jgi:hypothetical protein
VLKAEPEGRSVPKAEAEGWSVLKACGAGVQRAAEGSSL